MVLFGYICILQPDELDTLYGKGEGYCMQVHSGLHAFAKCKSSEKHLECVVPPMGRFIFTLCLEILNGVTSFGAQACEMRVCLPLGEEFLRRWWLLWVEWTRDWLPLSGKAAGTASATQIASLPNSALFCKRNSHMFYREMRSLMTSGWYKF